MNFNSKFQEKVSILIPLSNNQNGCDKAINSILEQTYKNIEVLICLNGNTKNFDKQIIQKYKKNKKIKFYKIYKKNIVFALNHLIKKAKGFYFARFDTDDFSHKDRIEKQILYMKDKKIDFLSSNCNVYREKKFLYNHKTVFSNSIYTNPIIHPTIIAKKYIFKNYMYNNIPYAEDYEFYLRLYLNNIKMYNLNENLISYNLNKKNIKNAKRAFYLLLSTLIISKGFRNKLNINPKFFERFEYDKNFEKIYKLYANYYILNNKIYKIVTGLFFLIFSNKLIRKNLINSLIYNNKKIKNVTNKSDKIFDSKPLVSVIIPTYNSENTIYKTLLSVKKQTYKNIEIIVVDNSKNNKTVDIIKKNFNKIKIIQIKEKILPAEARNIGVKNIDKKSKFICFCDSDDIFKPEKTEYQINKMLSENIDISCTNADFINVKNNVITKNYFNYPFKDIDFELLSYKNVIITSSVIMKKKIFYLSEGFPESNFFYSFEDYFLWLKILQKYKVKFIDKSLIIYRDNRQHSASSRSKHIIDQRFRIILFFLIKLKFSLLSKLIIGNIKLAKNWIEQKIKNNRKYEYINLL